MSTQFDATKNVVLISLSSLCLCQLLEKGKRNIVFISQSVFDCHRLSLAIHGDVRFLNI